MANKQYIYLSGKAKWANKLFAPDLKFKNWSVLLYPNEESYSKILELKKGKDDVQGLLNIIKKDEDGYCLTLKRPTEKLIRGKMIGYAPPLVLNADNSPFNPQGPQLGNGSDITCKIEYYEYAKPAGGRGSAIRLESVRVDNLVPFKKDDFSKADAQQASGLTDQPPPLF